MRPRTVLTMLVATAVLFAAALALSVEAYATASGGPRFSATRQITGAEFSIPPRKNGATWTLNLWSHGQLLGTTSGTSGRLAVGLAAAQTGDVQADVRTTGADGTSRFYAGNRVASTCRPPTGTTSNASTTPAGTTTAPVRASKRTSHPSWAHNH